MRIIHFIREFSTNVRTGVRPLLRVLLAPRNVLPLTVFTLMLGCGFYLLEQNRKIRDNDEQLVVQQILATQESELSRRLSHMLSSTYFLAQEVARSQGRFKRFDKYAATLLQRMDGISNLQLAPGGVIS